MGSPAPRRLSGRRFSGVDRRVARGRVLAASSRRSVESLSPRTNLLRGDRPNVVTVIITGGAGFIGSNAAARFLSLGERVAVLDNLSRPGGEQNLAWLRERGLADFERIDVRDAAAVRRFLAERADASLVLHLASQVAVTVAIDEPRLDFDVNVGGTLNVLEGIRAAWPDGRQAPLVVYASTNKVYGGLAETGIVEGARRFQPVNGWRGVREDQPLRPETPHAVSKAAAEAYLRAYSYTYGVPTVTFRQSCIYGPRQLGAEEQGWVAWLSMCAARGEPVRLYGDGRQVRDLLHVDDLVDAFVAAHDRREQLSGQAYNLGGGPGLTLSLLELLERLERWAGHAIATELHPWRTGDQKIYVSCVDKAAAELDWRPRVDLDRGLANLWEWVRVRA